MSIDEKLDNPVWHSLTETHQAFAMVYDHIKFYHPDYCPFGGFINPENIAEPIDEYAQLTGNFFIIGQKPTISDKVILKNELICLQMIIREKIDYNVQDEIVELKEEHLDDLLALVKLVYPEYFKKKTASLGNYFGIYKHNQLVAITGERMQMNDCIEVSAVITHPDHTGKGYAKQLVTHTVNKIISQNKIAFLHVAESNTGAIGLYKKLDFYTRKKISVWTLQKRME